MRKLTPTQVKAAVEAALTRQRQFVISFKASDNPQTRELLRGAEGSVAALEAVLEMLDGDPTFINILSNGKAVPPGTGKEVF
jgi:hypothetical protein